MEKTAPKVLWIAIVISIIAYFLPWLVNSKSAILTVGAYDLAEWVSLVPSVRIDNPLLWQALILRLHPLLWAGIITFSIQQNEAKSLRLLQIAFIALLTIGLLPSLNFIGRIGEDFNYRQQFILAVITVFISIIGFSGVLRRFSRWIVVGFALVGLVVSVAGYSTAQSLMMQYGLQPEMGLGVVFSVMGYGIALLYTIGRAVKER
ncbi:MAG: hypothetical protein D6712_08135 [Chloroflexi bacterium]|nr:MAG: hypothetical protein D6712_08135 [Chloroflexota bacterium]